ncbi:substrate-binding periplasmic protein [Pseudoalteromonas sp.]|uniref:substrate-binding periplasmic protein n=1 Tax=Pseudoalteromonas sp. TaxID=53249 RepID=UPI003566CE97
MLKRIFAASLLATSFFSYAGAIKFGFNQHHYSPHVIHDDNFTAQSGIVLDVSKIVAEEAGFIAKLLPLPRKRIEGFLVEGKIDALCHTNPAWYPNPSLLWSKPLYRDGDVVVSNRKLLSLDAFYENKDFKLGTVLGYKYPEIAPYFATGIVKRFNSTSSKGSAARFIKGELDGFISSLSEANYLVQLKRFNVLAINDNQIHCTFSPKLSEEKRNRLLKATEQLKEKGEFEHILAKYIKPD